MENLKTLAIAVGESIKLALSNLGLEEELRTQALHDALTGLFNRRYLDDVLVREIERCRRQGQTLTVAMLDLDHFKRMNDSLGHEAGDEVLQRVAQCSRPAPSAQRAAATRQALIASGRQLFTSLGYFSVGVRDFAAHAGVTRGALYHHFGDKEGLFLAVFHAVEEDLLADQARISGAVRGNAWQQLRAGIGHYLSAALRPDVQRITLIDGPAVLGWHRWRNLEEGYSLGGLSMALQAAMDAALIRTRPVEPLAHVLLGSIMESALLIAHSHDPFQRRREVGAALDDLLGGLEQSIDRKGKA